MSRREHRSHIKVHFENDRDRDSMSPSPDPERPRRARSSRTEESSETRDEPNMTNPPRPRRPRRREAPGRQHDNAFAPGFYYIGPDPGFQQHYTNNAFDPGFQQYYPNWINPGFEPPYMDPFTPSFRSYPPPFQQLPNRHAFNTYPVPPVPYPDYGPPNVPPGPLNSPSAPPIYPNPPMNNRPYAPEHQDPPSGGSTDDNWSTASTTSPTKRDFRRLQKSIGRVERELKSSKRKDELQREVRFQLFEANRR